MIFIEFQLPRDVLLKDALQKAVLRKMFLNDVFLQWLQSSTKDFISIADLIN